MGTADSAMVAVWRAGIRRERVGGRPLASSGGSRWSAFEIVAMVLGFIVFWPIGLAILGYKFWQSRNGGPDLQTLANNKWQDARGMMWSQFWPWGCGADEAREPILMPLPATPLSTNGERRNSVGSMKSAASSTRRSASSPNMSDVIRRAKDREEFERFMAERRARPAGGPKRTERTFFLDPHPPPRSTTASKRPLSPDQGGGPFA